MQVAKQENENKTIDYPDAEIALEMSKNALTLKLVKDTHELARIGIEMDICVGSYAQQVVEKKSAILVLRSQNEKIPVGCVELRKWALVQARGPKNKALKDEEKDFLLNWVNSKGLDLKTKDLSA